MKKPHTVPEASEPKFRKGDIFSLYTATAGDVLEIIAPYDVGGRWCYSVRITRFPAIGTAVRKWRSGR